MTEQHLPATLYELEQIMIARVNLHNGDYAGIIELLPAVHNSAFTAGRMSRVLEISLLQTLALKALGKTGEALAQLEETLRVAETESQIRLFLEEAPLLIPLLKTYCSDTEHPARLLDFAETILREYQTLPQVTGGQGLIEPLSDREREILILVADGLSNQEIADKLYLALGTIKKHINNIYGKLGVNKRTQAIARARDLSII